MAWYNALGNAFMPVNQNLQQDQRAQLQNLGLLQTGLATWAAGANGARTGAGLAQGYLTGLGNTLPIADHAYRSQLAKRADERQQQLTDMKFKAAEQAQKQREQFGTMMFGANDRPAFKSGQDPQATPGLAQLMTRNPRKIGLAQLAYAGGAEPMDVVNLLKGQDPTTAMQNFSAAGYDLSTPEGQQAMRQYLMKNQGTTVNVNAAGEPPYKIPPNYMLRDRNNYKAGVQPIPGGPKDPQAVPRSTTETTDIANAESALKDLEIAKKKLFSNLGPNGELTWQGPDGTPQTATIDRWDAFTSDVPLIGSIPGTEGRDARQAVQRTVEILLRARSGAATPPEEIRKYVEMFAPSPLDSNEAAIRKIQALQDFYNRSLDLLKSHKPGDPVFDQTDPLKGGLSPADQQELERLRQEQQ